jgi:hypothetical protein
MEDSVGKEAPELLLIRNWESAVRNRGGWRKNTGKSMVWKRAEGSYKEKYNRDKSK